MKVTFMMGNGLDKAVGLKTGYADFYEWYLAQANEYPEEQKLKDAIKTSIENGDQNWADFEVALGQFTSEFFSDSNFLDCHEAGVRALRQYLQETYRTKLESDPNFLVSVGNGLRPFVQNFYEDLDPDDKEYFSSILRNNTADIGVISLNYTPLLEDVVYNATLPLARNIVHPHGTLERYPILGVDSVDQIANSAFWTSHEMKASMIKSESDGIIGMKWGDAARKMIDESDVICIFGCSMGITDARWWSHIAQWLAVDGFDNNHMLIIYWYTELENDNLSVRRLLQLDAVRESVKDQFCHFADYEKLGAQTRSKDEFFAELKEKIIVDCKKKTLYSAAGSYGSDWDEAIWNAKEWKDDFPKRKKSFLSRLAELFA